MSRSHKKHPAGGCCTAASEKREKRLSARVWRKRVREALAHDREQPHERVFRNPYDWGKDGHKWFVHASGEPLRKLLRK